MESVVIIFDFFFAMLFFCDQYRSCTPKLVWVNPRILIYGKRRSQRANSSHSISMMCLHNHLITIAQFFCSFRARVSRLKYCRCLCCIRLRFSCYRSAPFFARFALFGFSAPRF